MGIILYYKFKYSSIILHTFFKTNIVKSGLDKILESPQIIGHHNHISKKNKALYVSGKVYETSIHVSTSCVL